MQDLLFNVMSSLRVFPKQLLLDLCGSNELYNQKYSRLRCLLHVKGLVICIYLCWSGSTYSSVQTKYDRNRFKVMATYLQQ